MTQHPLSTSGQKLSWAIDHHLVEDFQLKNEMVALLAGVYAASAEDIRGAFIAQAKPHISRKARTTSVMSYSISCHGCMPTHQAVVSLP